MISSWWSILNLVMQAARQKKSDSNSVGLMLWELVFLIPSHLCHYLKSFSQTDNSAPKAKIWKPSTLACVVSVSVFPYFRGARSGVKEEVGGFQIPGVCLQAFPFLLSPSFFFRCRLNFRAAKTSKFARKPHGNACYAGYKHLCVFNSVRK